MIKLAGIGHVLLRVADEEASKRFYTDVLGFAVAEQDPEHGGVFMTLGDGFHALASGQSQCHGGHKSRVVGRRNQLDFRSPLRRIAAAWLVYQDNAVIRVAGYDVLGR